MQASSINEQKCLDDNIYKLIKCGINYDAGRREIVKGKEKVIIYFLTSLISEEYIETLIISLNKFKSFANLDKKIPLATVNKVYGFDKIMEDLSNGNAIIITKNCSYLVDARMYPSRSISEPQTEKTIRGSRDGFVETLNTNVGLIRRRIKSDKLCVESFVLSKDSKMQVALLYLENRASMDVVKTLRQKIDKIDVESLIMSDRALEEILFNQRLSPFPLVRYTERPDVASINMMNGKILIMVDTSSSVMITPTTFIDHTKHVEEFRQSPIIGSFTSFLRTLAIFISIFFVPIWLLLIQPSNISNLFSISLSQNVSMTRVVIQIFIAELIFEVIRIASIHTPSHLTSAISLVAAVVLGQVSMELGLFLPEILLISAISAICGFATPSYELSMTNKLIKLLLIVVSFIFGKIGFLITIAMIFIMMCTIKIWNIPYLYPICPLDVSKAKNMFYRVSANKKKRL